MFDLHFIIVFVVFLDIPMDLIHYFLNCGGFDYFIIDIYQIFETYSITVIGPIKVRRFAGALSIFFSTFHN